MIRKIKPFFVTTDVPQIGRFPFHPPPFPPYYSLNFEVIKRMGASQSTFEEDTYEEDNYEEEDQGMPVNVILLWSCLFLDQSRVDG